MGLRLHPIAQMELVVLVDVDNEPHVGKQRRLVAAMTEIFTQSTCDLVVVLDLERYEAIRSVDTDLVGCNSFFRES